MAIDKVVKDLVIPERQSDMWFVEGDTLLVLPTINECLWTNTLMLKLDHKPYTLRKRYLNSICFLKIYDSVWDILNKS